MNTLQIFFIAVFSIFSFTACHAQRELAELSRLDGVQSIYIGSAMLKIAKRSASPSLITTGFNGSKLVDKLTSIEVVNVESKKSLKQANEMIDAYMARQNQEVLADIIDDEDHVVITGAFNEATSTFSNVIIRVQEPYESVIILLKGDIPLALLQEAITTF